ncbi:MAG: hypothetical protein LLF80_06505 [Porphyromonadaceae bacterium]|nr:hypothetical protein [Porphyromonadaceae bacterium]
MPNFEAAKCRLFRVRKISSDTALRDIQDLMAKGILRKEAQGGRSTNYELIVD